MFMFCKFTASYHSYKTKCLANISCKFWGVRGRKESEGERKKGVWHVCERGWGKKGGGEVERVEGRG